MAANITETADLPLHDLTAPPDSRESGVVAVAVQPLPDAAATEAGAAGPPALPPATAAVAGGRRARKPSWPLIVLAVIAILAALKLGAAFFVPVVCAILMFYALVRAVNLLERLHLPRALGAALVMSALIALVLSVGYGVWGQTEAILSSLPRSASKLSATFSKMREDKQSPLRTMGEAARAVDDMMRGGTPGKTAPAAPAAASSTGASELVWKSSLSALQSLGSIATVLLLCYFLLTDGDHFRRKWVKLLGTKLTQKKVTVQVLDDIDRAVQRYLGMLLVTNAVLGVITYFALLALGVANAGAWAVLAALLHVIPYFGPLAIALGVFIAGVQQFAEIQPAVFAALATLAIAAVIGTFAQTWMASRIARMNATGLFIALLLFGWLWGGAGLFLAIPIAVICKIVFSALPSLNPVAELLSD